MGCSSYSGQNSSAAPKALGSAELAPQHSAVLSLAPQLKRKSSNGVVVLLCGKLQHSSQLQL